MKAFRENEIVEIWEITKNMDNSVPKWVLDGFSKNYLRWHDDKLIILMSGLKNSAIDNIKRGLISTVGGGFTGYNMYSIGYIGDFIDLTNGVVISPYKFKKNYKI